MKLVVQRFPWFMGIAMEVAPLVRLGHITDAEGKQLIELRYMLKRAEIAQDDAA